jgi:hypothetical protein
MNITNQVVILSAEREVNSIESNRQRTATLEGVLTDLNLLFNKAQGVFNGGTVEDNFVVLINNNEELESIKALAFNNFAQDAILYQDANQEASLIFKNGESKSVGVLQEVDSTDGLENYTLLKGKIYTTIPRT